MTAGRSTAAAANAMRAATGRDTLSRHLLPDDLDDDLSAFGDDVQECAAASSIPWMAPTCAASRVGGAINRDLVDG